MKAGAFIQFRAGWPAANLVIKMVINFGWWLASLSLTSTLIWVDRDSEWFVTFFNSLATVAGRGGGCHVF